jgi:hypothetical protein
VTRLAAIGGVVMTAATLADLIYLSIWVATRERAGED